MIKVIVTGAFGLSALLLLLLPSIIHSQTAPITDATWMGKWNKSVGRIGFGIDMAFGDPTLDPLTCYGEYTNLKTMIYPIYAMENMLVTSMNVGNVTSIDPTIYPVLSQYTGDDMNTNIQKYIQKIFTTQMRYSDKYSVTTNITMTALNTTSNRRLLRTQKNKNQEKEQPQPQPQYQQPIQQQQQQLQQITSSSSSLSSSQSNYHRQLQATNCYSICNTYTPRQLKLAGCYDICNRRQLQQYPNYYYNNNNNDTTLDDPNRNDDPYGRYNQRIINLNRGYIRSASYKSILPMRGNITMSVFYDAVRLNIDPTDPCRAILLNVTYRTFDLYITPPL